MLMLISNPQLKYSVLRLNMLCCISGQTPVDPVVSKKSGYLFERALVQKSIFETGCCPVSGEPLTLDDLMPIQGRF